MDGAADFPKPPPVWVLALTAWVGLGLAFTPTLQEALAEAGPPLRIGGLVLFWSLYAGGVVAFVVPRPWGAVLTRLGAGLYVGVGLFLAAAVDAPPVLRIVPPAVAAATLGICLAVPVGERFLDGASYPGERRFGLRWPREAVRGASIAVLVPAAAVAAVLLGLGAHGFVRWLAAAVALVALAASWPLLRALLVLAERCLVFTPQAAVVTDPYVLADAIRIPYPRILDASVAPGDLATGDLLDLRGGFRGAWLQTVFDSPLEVPGRRPLPHFVAANLPALPNAVTGVALAVTAPSRCLQVAGTLGLPVQGSALDVEAELDERARRVAEHAKDSGPIARKDDDLPPKGH